MGKTQNDIERLLAIDALLIKAGDLGTEAPFANIERRLLQFTATHWRSDVGQAIHSAVQLANEGKSATTVAGEISYRLDGWERVLEPAIQAATRQGYIEAKRQMLYRVHGYLPPLESRTPNVKRVIKAPRELSIQPSFDQRDEAAIEQLVAGQLHWIGEFYDDQLSDEIDGVVRDTMLEQGLGREEAGKFLEQRLAAKLGIGASALPSSWTGRAAQYFEMIAANVATNARVYGSLGQMAQIGVTRYTITAIGDERTCSRCILLDGTSYSVEHAVQLLNQIAAADSPDDIKALHPWANSKEDVERNPGKFTFPPFHGRCRCAVDVSEDAEITYEPVTGWVAA